MLDSNMDRKQFLTCLGTLCAGSCLCVAGIGRACAAASAALEDPGGAAGTSSTGASVAGAATAPSAETAAPAAAGEARAVTRIKFAEKWAARFFRVLDENLDESTRDKLIMANGRACYLAWIAETGQQNRPVTLERFTAWAERNAGNVPYQVAGNVIDFHYDSAAETGLPAQEGQCLCPFVETKPEGLPGSYCLCSVGYVKEMHEQLFQRPCQVELIEAVLRGGKRCRFRITVA